MAPKLFGDRLAGLVDGRASQLVVGLDPDPMRLWPQAYEVAESQERGTAQSSPSERAAYAVAVHCRLVLEAVADHAVATKLQVGCFERLGAPGWAALAETVQRAREHDLLVLADAKRGDIDVTAGAYAQAYFGATPTPYGEILSIAADALTVNPLLGIDSVKPFVNAARDNRAGVFALVRTSNRGAADVQDRELQRGGTVSERLAQIVRELGAEGVGTSGLSDVGAVVGATAPDRLARLRELMPETIFLLPGVGAQGGRVEALAPALGEHPASVLISASRGIVGAGADPADDPAAAARREAARLQELAWKLGR